MTLDNFPPKIPVELVIWKVEVLTDFFFYFYFLLSPFPHLCHSLPLLSV